ncbi:molybdate ABC transporter substrate-binding protein [Sulfitobacter sp. F26169L]|uniref:molybdate ABC transporter substrate-binding protein n=1 Tax=Sulfitobacter sp. F26169L TaxID=2996015 RepID=UPI002260B770|nr:molybdate ABC transporter substrate-binding protein [Sulfitobacter sp. F26169L]
MRCLITLFLSLYCFVAPAQAESASVFAAASLRGALNEIADSYPEDITLSFAGSGTLARQVAAGAPADAIVLAHRDWATWLDTRGLILTDTLVEVAGGQLVLVGPPDAADITAPDAATLIGALKGGRLAIGQHEAVPAGAYAHEWLQHIGAWDTMTPYLAETDNVRAALALVAMRAAPLGVVYASDAVAEPRIRIVYTIPPDTHAAIRYPAAALTEAGRGFVAYLSTPEATAIFAKHGFAQ